MGTIMIGVFGKNVISSQNPIGVFDSGMGGIYLLKKLVRTLPMEDFIYFGDSANAPYGTKTMKQIRALSVCSVEYLIKRHVKALVIACNTATLASKKSIQVRHPEIPVIGIEPALKQAVAAFPGRNIVVMATPFTLSHEKLERQRKHLSESANVIFLPIHGLVELIELGITDGPAIRELITRSFAQCPCDRIDAVVLGCTHFFHVKNEILRVLGGKVSLLENGGETALRLYEKLKERNLLRNEQENGPLAGGAVTFLNSFQNMDVLERMWMLYQR